VAFLRRVSRGLLCRLTIGLVAIVARPLFRALHGVTPAFVGDAA
jgi:hypothetical protein